MTEFPILKAIFRCYIVKLLASFNYVYIVQFKQIMNVSAFNFKEWDSSMSLDCDKRKEEKHDVNIRSMTFKVMCCYFYFKAYSPQQVQIVYYYKWQLREVFPEQRMTLFRMFWMILSHFFGIFFPFIWFVLRCCCCCFNIRCTTHDNSSEYN